MRILSDALQSGDHLDYAHPATKDALPHANDAGQNGDEVKGNDAGPIERDAEAMMTGAQVIVSHIPFSFLTICHFLSIKRIEC